MTVQETAQKDPKSLIGRAFAFAKKAHSSQKRENGEPFFNHALMTAEFLDQWHLDETTIAAGLLHDVPQTTKISVSEIEKEFGREVAFLLDGLIKLSLVKYKNTATKIENLRKMILALSGDLRIVFIKLANRLHNLKTIEGIPESKWKYFALETNEIYAPLAYQIGMQNLSGQLYDLCFPILHPKEYEWLTENVKEQYEARHEYLKRIKPVLENTLKENGLVPLFIDFRAKRYSSLYFKLREYNMDLERIYDLVTTWIVFKDVKDCYEALGVIHQTWPPLPGRIKDYIASPKPNGYRSLHTTVVGPEGKHIEIQIHTEKMHEENKNGLAAHWLYKQKIQKEAPSKKSLKNILEEVGLLKYLRRWENNKLDPALSYQEFIEAMKIDFFNNRLFVITPKGDVIDLPKGSTPVDFAYSIHTVIGETAFKAKINGALKSLDVELKSGDVIEILTQKNRKPQARWLTFVKTAHAREHIRNAIHKKKEQFEKLLIA
ncbi:MAG: bifunctional (p)ppGpp synthetase/guanosine-3',5'-bis(diphosphate) 3'-pyrophosphohydrolase [Candidatus Liptonbacteria bacterium]|nr:bifunctional (p)ppGpp synthetase/guanosine-3',5'-bis(diphosphate) 3'-pyrophosphohydrolase [Candidatus Liptonbacteria bacterium]